MRAFLHHYSTKACFQAALAGGLLTGLALAASAQSDTFEGNPDSSAFIRIPSNTDDWTRHFRVGALVGLNISANFSIAGSFNVKQPAGVFDNGYVYPSDNAFGTTTEWGYDSASQYNAANHTLSMTGTTAFTPDAAVSGEQSGSAFLGFDLAYGGNLWYWKHARVGWECGLGLLPINITKNQSVTGKINQNIYTFSTGTIESMPPPGYPGRNSISGPAIYSTATSTNQSTPSSSTINSSQTLDVTLYTMRLGPTFYWDITREIGVSLGGGPAIGIVSGNLKYNDTFSGESSNTGQVSGTGVVYGGYVNAAVMYHLVQNGDIYVGAQYMPMSSTTISGGGREAKLDLGGQIYISAGINWPF